MKRNPNSESRNPKEIRHPNSETIGPPPAPRKAGARNAPAELVRPSKWFRISDFFRISAFGIRVSSATLLLLLFLTGCFDVKDELVLAPDGSGTVRIETRSGLGPEMFESLGMAFRMGGSEALLVYPPITASEAKKFFPGNEFTVSVHETKTAEGESLVIVEAAFQELNALLASPYARARQLSVVVEGDALTLKAVSGIETIVRFSEMKDDGMLAFGAAGLSKLKQQKDKMRAEFRVTLPNAIAASNGERDGNTAAWVIDRAALKEADEFFAQAGQVLEASCSAKGLALAPSNPVRLGLLPFGELKSGAAGDTTDAPEAEKIIAATQFVPYALQVTRSVDLSGESGRHENQAQLIGAMVLPRELAPQKWGEARLEEAVDSRGNDLTPDRRGHFGFRSNFSRRFASDDEEDGEDEDAASAGAELRRLITLRFQPPDLKAKDITRIKAAITLQYYGGSHVAKLTNAIPANWIMDMTKSMNFGRFNPSERTLSSPDLVDLGLTVNLQMAMVQEGMTMLVLGVSGTEAALTGLQAFDADGRPWPTIMQEMNLGEHGSCTVMIPGQPKAPLSLALLASGIGAAVQVPILIENLPLTQP
jgi:hypothetical protein